MWLKEAATALGYWQAASAAVAFPVISYVAFLDSVGLSIEHVTLHGLAEYSFSIYVFLIIAFYLSKIIGFFVFNVYLVLALARILRRQNHFFHGRPRLVVARWLLRHDLHAARVLRRIRQDLLFGAKGSVYVIILMFFLFLVFCGGFSLDTLWLVFFAFCCLNIIVSASVAHTAADTWWSAAANLEKSYGLQAKRAQESDVEDLYGEAFEGASSRSGKRASIWRDIISLKGFARDFRDTISPNPRPIFLYGFVAFLCVVAGVSGVLRGGKITVGPPLFFSASGVAECGFLLERVGGLWLFKLAQSGDIVVLPQHNVDLIALSSDRC